MLLICCVLKCGFINIFCVEYLVVNFWDFDKFEGFVSFVDLLVCGFVCKGCLVKIFGNGDVIKVFIV